MIRHPAKLKPRSPTHQIDVPFEAGKQTPIVSVQPKALFDSLCATCKFSVWRRYMLAGKWAQSMDCERHIIAYPNAQQCRDYEREPGTDDAVSWGIDGN